MLAQFYIRAKHTKSASLALKGGGFCAAKDGGIVIYIRAKHTEIIHYSLFIIH